MSRDPRVFQSIEKQVYDQNEDRIRVLSAALNGLSRLIREGLWTDFLTPAENEMVRAELIKSLISNHLDNTTDEQIEGYLDKTEAELESNNEDN